ncbi:MAG: DUF4124 domain-containing protein [Gammaproteobacteria bacterium]
MKRSKLLAGVLLLTGLGTCLTATAQTIFKIVDADGNVTYTDRLPSSVAAETPPIEKVSGLDIEATDHDSVDTLNQQTLENAQATADNRSARRQIQTERQAEQAREKNCATARSGYKTQTEHARLYRELPDGEREYLTGDEIDAQRSVAARSVEEWCG